MGPLFGLPLYDSEEPPPPRRRALKGAAVGMVAALFIVVVLLILSPKSGLSDSRAIAVGAIVVVAMLTVFPAIVVNLLKRTDGEKRKHGLDGQDMYTLIDRMVDDLDEDELDYLRRRLEQREHSPKGELADSLGDLLDQRQEDRQAGQR